MISNCVFIKGTSNKSSHQHEFHQLIYISKGTVKVMVNGEESIARDGALIILSRLEKHSVTALSGEYERYDLRINPNAVSKDLDLYLYSVLVNRPKGFKHIISTKNTEILSLFEKINTEFNSNNEYKETMLEILFKELLITIYRTNSELFSLRFGQVGLVQKIQKSLENDIKNPCTLEMLSNEYFLSKYYLSHIFKKVTGYSIMGYLHSLRISTAKQLLMRTNMNIGEIIESCGFSDNSNFSRSFKQETGLTPTNFRKKYLKK